MLLVFDFHGCLSLKSGEQLNNLKKYLKIKDTKWYSAMKMSNIDPYIMMPTLDEVIYFVDYMRKYKCIFAIASMLEDEIFMYDMMKYCFESKNKISPFVQEAIISNQPFKKYDKSSHIFNILKRMKLPKMKIILIDDNEKNVNYMNNIGIKSILVKNYFRIKDWNERFNE